ncbi:hypothetical protein LPZ50_21730, partial [Bordetella petrii]|nr:hypothetical protein [Bordetella petrii]
MAGVAHTVLAMPAVAAEVRAGTVVAVPLAPRVETRLMVATSLNQPLTQAGRAVLAEIKPVLVQAICRSELPLHIHVEPARAAMPAAAR